LLHSLGQLSLRPLFLLAAALHLFFFRLHLGLKPLLPGPLISLPPALAHLFLFLRLATFLGNIHAGGLLALPFNLCALLPLLVGEHGEAAPLLLLFHLKLASRLLTPRFFGLLKCASFALLFDSLLAMLGGIDALQLALPL
jgi:hypothetical protein